MAPEVTCALDIRAALGECPVWCPREAVLWWVDIVAPSLNRFDPARGTNRAWALPEDVGSFALRERGGAVVALRSGFHALDLDTGRVDTIVDPEPVRPGTRFNDGKCDRAGRFWAGTMYEPGKRKDAALYRLDPDLSARRMDGGVTTSNGLAWSPDDRTMYWSDSHWSRIDVLDFDKATGAIANRRLFAELKPGLGRPDGAAVDREGHYWSALYDGGQIARFRPDGVIDRLVPMPVRCPTMVAFGGADLRTVYVTSARHERPADELRRRPQSGSLFAFRVDVPGLPEPRFAG